MAQQTVKTDDEMVRIGKIESSGLDQLIQVLEISFIFLLTYSLITLFDAAFEQIDLYNPIAGDVDGETNYLGRGGIGSLDGGNFEEIVRVTLVFNLMLFAFSLFFGMWIRYTRDGWTFERLGFTLNTPNYKFKNIAERGLILGLLAVVLQFTIMTLYVTIDSGSLEQGIMNIQAYSKDSGGNTVLYENRELNAEYYFGIVEMGFIWPMSAGFFFFAYAHNSLKDKFNSGIANVLGTLFYVFYLSFFFMIPVQGKMDQIFNHPENNVGNAFFWSQALVFFLVLYISFSAFGETKSIVLPFLLNFVFNVGLTLFRASNTLLYDEFSPLMLIPYFLSITILLFYFFRRKFVYSTISKGITDLKEIFDIPLARLLGLSILFIILSFIVPGILEYVVFLYIGDTDFPAYLLPLTVGIYFVLIILFAIIVLTYEPTQVYDVMLMTKDGRPISSHIELFQSDEVLISGFFAALSSVSAEIDSNHQEIKSIKQGEREILIEDGVLTRVIALVDKDQQSIRNQISMIHRNFETMFSDKINSWNGSQFKPGDEFVERIGLLSIEFSVPQQTRWIGTLTMVFAPLFIFLLGLILSS